MEEFGVVENLAFFEVVTFGVSEALVQVVLDRD